MRWKWGHWSVSGLLVMRSKFFGPLDARGQRGSISQKPISGLVFGLGTDGSIEGGRQSLLLSVLPGLDGKEMSVLRLARSGRRSGMDLKPKARIHSFNAQTQ
jgi:hypothetical protein